MTKHKHPCWACMDSHGRCEYPKTSKEKECPICGCTRDDCPPREDICYGTD